MTLRRIGKTPEARVRWLLDFVRRDPAQLSADARKAAVVDSLFAVQGRRTDLPRRPDIPWTPKAFHNHRWLLGDTHELLRDVVESLANGRPYYVAVPDLIWELRPPPRRPAGARHSAPVTRDSAQAEMDWRATPAMVVLAFVDDLNAIGADRLRACPLERDGVRCGVVFLGTRGKRYCTPPHAQAAAWQAYLARGGDVKRKQRRK